MVHFEDIWNEAEQVNALRTQTPEEIFENLSKFSVNLASAHYNKDKERAGELVGRLLFELCAYCQVAERDYDTSINSAVVLQNILDEAKVKLLDP